MQGTYFWGDAGSEGGEGVDPKQARAEAQALANRLGRRVFIFWAAGDITEPYASIEPISSDATW